MGTLSADEVFLFEGFRLDPRAGGLFRVGENGVPTPVAIGSRGLDLLTLLVKRHGDVVSKDEIMAAVWPEMIVEDSNLPTQISALRRVLDSGRSNGSCIQTVAGRGYRFVAEVTCAGVRPPPVAEPARAEVSARHAGRVIVAAAAAALILIFGGWWLLTSPSSPPAIAAEKSISQPFVAPRLSIVVLPFANFSNDPDQQYFADGVTDDLTTDLSRIWGMFVIARNTAFTYRNKQADAKQIGRELGVRYVLEGSFQRSESQVRINAQLIDAESNAHLWAERFERDAGDLFALQNEITTRIAVALKWELAAAEAARRSERPDVLDYILRARAAYAKPVSRERNAEGMRLLELALALDPHSAEVQSMMAGGLAGRVLNGLTETPSADIERAKGLIEQASAASPYSPTTHISKANLLRAQRRYAEAIPEYQMALAYNRNYVYAYFGLGQCKLHTGSIGETIPLIERAIRLSPRDPDVGVWYENIGDVHLLQSRTDQAIFWLEKARSEAPGHPIIRGDLAAAYALAGETERAAAELAEARRLSTDDRYSSITRLKAVRNFAALTPKIRGLSEATLFAGLRKAGMPEE